MKKLAFLILTFAALHNLAACSLFSKAQAIKPASFAPSSEMESEGVRAGETWAIYWYICGSALESAEGSATYDLKEMLRAKLPESVKVVIEAGGAEEWKNDFDPAALNRYLYDSNGLCLLEKLPLASMGDPKTLEEFLGFCCRNYPADRKAIILWGHGGGSIAGFAEDSLFANDALDMGELRTALGSVSAADKASPPYEVIGFDACLMATVDVMSALNGFARWMVASEEREQGSGWEYERLLEALAAGKGIGGGELGISICEALMADCREYEETGDAKCTLSVIDMAKADELLSAFYSAGTEALLSAGNNAAAYKGIEKAALEARKYGDNDPNSGYCGMVDLGDFMRRARSLLPNSSGQVLDALEEAVYYSVCGEFMKGSTGLSFYYSFDLNSKQLEHYSSIYGYSPWIELFKYAIGGE